MLPSNLELLRHMSDEVNFILKQQTDWQKTK